ncbi:hypothetical protein NPIL_119911 [Nephila pilipes]|uniref:Uncharacterized protein n=1 Tax=Nephila pilipes TaxID=299642 RepID=A0A8X6TF92_NEPPI|nr:hypothetical protein NPIL_119911 [Nephila pilipes]
MAICFVLEIALCFLQCALNYVLDIDLKLFLEIFIFELVMEFFNYLTLNTQLSSPSENGLLVPFDENGTTNANNRTSVVRSLVIYKICQALELDVELASVEASSAHIPTLVSSVRKLTPLPAVYSVTTFKLCQALDLNAELRPPTERPTFGNRKRKPVPVVCSPTVFLFCQALELKAKLAEF